MLIDRAATRETVVGGEGVTQSVLENSEDLEGFGHHFGADVVAGEDENGAGW